jgi:hypothetical protein
MASKEWSSGSASFGAADSGNVQLYPLRERSATFRLARRTGRKMLEMLSEKAIAPLEARMIPT